MRFWIGVIFDLAHSYALLHLLLWYSALLRDLRLNLLGGSHDVDHKENVLAVLYFAKEGAIGLRAKVAVLSREGSFRTYALAIGSGL